MVTTLLLDDFEEEEYEYYGLRFQPYPEYKLIYKINSLLNICFNRANDLDISEDNQIFCYSVYCLEDPSGDNSTFIVKNKSHELKVKIENSLFQEVNTSKYLIQRFNKYDYLLKLNVNLTLPHDIPLSLQTVGVSILVDKLNLKESEKKLLYL